MRNPNILSAVAAAAVTTPPSTVKAFVTSPQTVSVMISVFFMQEGCVLWLSLRGRYVEGVYSTVIIKMLLLSAFCAAARMSSTWTMPGGGMLSVS